MRTNQLIATGAAAGIGLTVLSRRLRASRAISFADRVVVIVGGSRGLGLVLARELVAERAQVVLVARDPDTLAEAASELAADGGHVSAHSCDITDPQQVDATVAEIESEYGRIDVLINDAGVIDVGPLDHMTAEDFERAMSIHFRGPLYMTMAALPIMRRGGARRIVNISSIGGRVAFPHLTPYTASKFALTGLSEGLRTELARDGFHVTTICPGLMRTGSTYNARFKGQYRREFAWFHLLGSIPGLSIDARRAARRILDACRHGDATLTITLPARLAVLAHTILPGLTSRALDLTNRMLPGAMAVPTPESRSGWQSISRFVPSRVTALADRATVRNNEIPQAAD